MWVRGWCGGCNRLDGEVVCVAGRVHRRAIQGKLYFYDLVADGAKVRSRVTCHNGQTVTTP